MFEFPYPTSPAEWLAFASAVATALLGLMLFVLPRLTLRAMGIGTVAGRDDAVAEIRSVMAGFLLAAGLGSIMFAQPFIYLVLGACWAVTVLGRIVTAFVDRAMSRIQVLQTVIEMLLAAGPLAYVF